jgi:hydroxyacylglutathione hydrolase
LSTAVSMNVKQMYTGCLAQGAYYIESNGEAAVIDPLREVSPYIDLANQRHTKIKYIFETHFHADFVSGHIDLAKKTGATIVYGPTEMETGFHAYIAKDGEEFWLGKAIIRLIHTPGHTMESSCYLLIDEGGEEKALFTGDTLFIGDVGRPDLAQHVVAELTEEKLAGKLYDSLREKIMPLNDHLTIYPGHGAGSACGKNMSKETWDTLGNQKKTNYALRKDLTKAEFTREILDGLTSPPSYFQKNVLLNIQGYESIDQVFERGLMAIPVSQFASLATQKDVLVIDTRDPDQFKKGFIPGSWNIGLTGSFAVWVGTLVKDINQKIALVTVAGKEQEAVTRLARVGYDHCIGFLEGGFKAWEEGRLGENHIPSISPEELTILCKIKNRDIVDVRKKSEFDSEHIIGAHNIPLDYIHESLTLLSKDHACYLHCAGGYRSVIFASIAKARGYHNIIDVEGGFSNMKQMGNFNLSAFVHSLSQL